MPADTPPAFDLPADFLSQGYALRPETEADQHFLLCLFASTREEELAPLVDWTRDQKDDFIRMQFAAQRHHYRTYMTDCAWSIIEHRGLPAGRLYLEPRGSRLHIVDIALMPAFRGQGLGTAILRALMEAAKPEGKGVSIFVEKFNPALRLYRRLGFTDIADQGVYLEMEWREKPAGAENSVS